MSQNNSRNNFTSPKSLHNSDVVIGYVTIIVINAMGLRDIRMFGKMEPYVVIEYRQNKYKTEANIEGKHTDPVWNTTFNIPLYSVYEEIKFSCFDKSFIKDQCICSHTVHINELQSLHDCE